MTPLDVRTAVRIALLVGLPASADPLAVFVTAAYSRSVTREPLAHERRRELFGMIHTRPGFSRTTLAETSEVATSTVRYHVDMLQTAGMVRTLNVFGQVRLAEASVPREHVDRLEDEGLLDRERNGRRIEMYLTRRIRSVPIGIALESHDLEYEASTER